MKRLLKGMAMAVSLCLALSVTAGASPLPSTASVYTAHLQELNDSGVSGVVHFAMAGDELTAHVHVTGLLPNLLHRVQVRGFLEGTAAVLPAFRGPLLTDEMANPSIGDRLL